MLILPIKKKYFDMILSGEKKEEYREIKPYYTNRFIKKWLNKELIMEELRNYGCIRERIILRNGYRKDSPQMTCRVDISIGQGKPEWGAEPGKEYYILEVLEVIKE